MKELSIEEKAKRYNEAIKRAKELLEIGVKDTRDKRVVLSFFPELKESEDEKMRKSIIYALRNGGFYDSDKTDEAIAWLEKQGEQKTSDKVEPKFNLYDWVVTDKGDTVQIGAVNNGYYTLFNGMDFNMSYVDKCWHKWTTEDAKDGDVLVSCVNKPFIYNGKFTEITVGAYCGIDIYGNFIVKKYIKECNWTNNDDIRPATKEQRDELKKAMLKAGYKWNADKKELIKL